MALVLHSAFQTDSLQEEYSLPELSGLSQCPEETTVAIQVSNTICMLYQWTADMVKGLVAH